MPMFFMIHCRYLMPMFFALVKLQLKGITVHLFLQATLTL